MYIDLADIVTIETKHTFLILLRFLSSSDTIRGFRLTQTAITMFCATNDINFAKGSSAWESGIHSSNVKW